MSARVSLQGQLLVLRELLALFTRHRHLSWALTRREVTQAYAGQVLGAFWSFAHPIILMGIYVFIFAYVFRIRIEQTREVPLDYTVYILSGLVPWLAFQETLGKATVAITANSSLVKQVVFPLETLPAKMALAAVFRQLVMFGVLIAYVLAVHRALPWTYALLPVLIFFQAMAMIGAAFALSAVGVFWRDVKDLVNVFCAIGLFLTPVLYLPGWVPEIFRPVLYVNPFSYMVWCYQDALHVGRIAHPAAWVVFLAGSPVTLVLGYHVFRKLKGMFANVL